MTSTLALMRQVMAQQPFSMHMGVEIEAADPTTGVVFRLPLRAEHLQHQGIVHGGVVAFLADMALAFTGGAALGGDIVTSEFKINYMRPARGTALIGRGICLSAGQSQATVRCDIFSIDASGGERLSAAAQGTITRVARGG